MDLTELNDETPGLYLSEEKTFYYIVTGGRMGINPIDRLRNVLMQRGVLSYVRENPNSSKLPFRICKYEEVREREIQVHPIYATPHIQKLAEEEAITQETVKPGTGGWG